MIRQKIGDLRKINYDDREGGKYAFVKFLALGRGLVLDLRLTGLETEAGRLQSIFWQMNDCLSEKWTEENRVIFQAAIVNLDDISVKLVPTAA